MPRSALLLFVSALAPARVLYPFVTFNGTVFKTSTSGALATLYSFQSPEGSPIGLTLNTDGTLFGGTRVGASTGSLCLDNNCGVIYKVTPAGSFTTVASFDGSDGTYTSQLTLGTGGANLDGAVFKLTPSGTLTTIYNFAGPDGSFSCGGLVAGSNGLFYGATSGGGANDDGTIFQITPPGKLTTLHSIDSADGAGPCNLLAAGDGSFYGFTLAGGFASGGTVFRITPKGSLTTLFNFPFRGAPNSLILASDGNLYGAVPFGVNFYGSIFQLTPSGTYNVLYTFTGAEGQVTFPSYRLQTTDGSILGSAGADGDDYGMIFRLPLSLPAFVQPLPPSGKAGAAIKILGANLKPPVTVTFNGTPATVTTVKTTEIVATVPAGATSGTLEVTTARRHMGQPSSVPCRSIKQPL